MKNTQSKITPIKIGNQPGTKYCFGCKDYSKIFRPGKVKMTSTILEKNLTVLFVDLMSQDLKKKKINN